MRSKKNILLLAIIITPLAVMVMASCTHTAQIVPATPVSFKADIIPILRVSCAIDNTCHSGPLNSGDNIDFDSTAAYQAIIDKQLVILNNPAASLLYVQVSTGIMPKAPYSALPSAQVNLILNWIKQGAKDN
jgi:hypothetical protein